ncbi:hypothetical protein ACCQ13_08065 [Xanthomonas sp. NCPPB 1638]|nr:hypothetical protein [Xanthomonas cucurbitae]
MAIAHAQEAGRVTLSESNAALIRQVLDDTPPSMSGATRSMLHSSASAPSHPYTPLSQRGFIDPELLAGELSAGQALRTAGLLATAADAVASGQRATQLLGQDNPLAAQSELAHFAGRNVGGWAGGSAAAYALGSSGAGPMVLIAADDYFMSVAGEKAAALLDNRAIYRQTDGDGTKWAFNGTAWAREGKADTTADGVDNPTATPIVASFAKARELNYQATNVAAALALKDAPDPVDPYRQPANATDRPSLSPADWKRDPADGQWHRLVKTAVSGANDRGSYVQETALPPRAAELDAQAQTVIARNIANSPGAIAARYELAYHRSGWAAEGLPMSPAVQQALPDPDALTASNGQRYYRDIEGRWTSPGTSPDANRVLELETTRAMLQQALAEQAQSIAAIQQTPPSPQDVQREQTLYRYRMIGTELQPHWREAIELAIQRTRETAGLTGDGALQLQRGPGETFGADSPVAHLQRGPDGVDRIVAVTHTEEIRQALRDVQARQAPLSRGSIPESLADPRLATSTADGASDGASSGGAGTSSPQLMLDVQARMQAASIAQERQERVQQEHLAQQHHHAQQQAQDVTQREQQLSQAQHARERAHDQQTTQSRQPQQPEPPHDRHVASREQAQHQAQETRDSSASPLPVANTLQHPAQRSAHDAAAHPTEPAQALGEPRLAADLAHQQALARLAHEGDAHGVAQPAARAAATRVAAVPSSASDDAQRQAAQPLHSHQIDARQPQVPLSTSQARPADLAAEPEQVRQPLHSLSPAVPIAARHGDAPAWQTAGPDTPDAAATMSRPGLPIAERAIAAGDSEIVAPQASGLAQAGPSDPPAAAASKDPNTAWDELYDSLRALRLQGERDLERNTRVADERRARIGRGEQPFTALELHGEDDPDSPPARVDARYPRQPMPHHAAGAHATDQQGDRPALQRTTITGDPDVDDLVYALDSKNDVAIAHALKRVANSAQGNAFAQEGHAHLDAKAQQEAQEHVAAHQALGMDVAPEVQTSRGPVMVLTLPQFAHGPTLPYGPQGDGGGGSGDGGGGGGG